MINDRNSKAWNITPPAIYRRGPQDVIHHHVGVTAGERVDNIKNAFGLFLTNEILDIIMRETNREASRVFAEWNAAHPDQVKTWRTLNQTENCAPGWLFPFNFLNWITTVLF